MTTTARIKQIADNESIKITALEQKIGASKGVLSRAINNNTDIQSKWISRIVENYPHYNSTWLLTGEGDMLHKKENVVITQKDISSESICKECIEKDGMIKLLEKQAADKDGQIMELIGDRSKLAYKLRELENDQGNISQTG